MVIIYFSALHCKVQCKFTYFIKNGGMLIVFIKRDLFVAPINFTGHPSGSLRSWWYCVGARVKFWRRSRVPKKGVGTRYFSRLRRS